MTRARRFFLIAAVFALFLPGAVPAQTDEDQALHLTLKECVTAAFANNTEIKIAAFSPVLREQDITLSEAAFDPNFTSSASYLDVTSPSPTTLSTGLFDVRLDPNGQIKSVTSINRGTIIPRKFTRYQLDSTFSDPLRYGSAWSANLTLRRDTSSAINVGGQTFLPAFPETYYSALTLSWMQPLLRGFGRKVNETQITLASMDEKIGEEDFRKTVQDTLLEVESAYWTLVYERQDLEVRNEALALAQELLRLNKIRVDVGTLPPIDITQAEAGVASREEAVIVAEANIGNAEDRLRRVMGLDPKSSDWTKPIVPEEDLSIVERSVDLSQEIQQALDHRTDLASARLQMGESDVTASQQRNSLKYRLDFRADYTLEGLAGDDNPLPSQGFARDPNTLAFVGPFSVRPGINESLLDALKRVSYRDFPTYQATLTLGIPIGNRSAQLNYTKARLDQEQKKIQYENLEQAAIVSVGTAVRQVQTDRKRIDAAEKNRILQEKTVEAEQKKFENGLSTSFEVLQLQRDLSEARSSENAARRDYRISLANLDAVTGVLENKLGVSLEDYQNPAELP